MSSLPFSRPDVASPGFELHGQDPAVAVVGAGAAGIAAGRMLARARIPFILLEARRRAGGRAVTQTFGAGHALDLGCEWLHSADRNVLARLAAATGVAIDRSPPPWHRRQEQIGFDDADQDAFDTASADYFARLEDAGRMARQSGQDGPASTLLAPGDRWNGLIDAISTYYNGAPLDRVSIVDFDRYEDSEVNWRIAHGYGAFIASLAADLPIRFDCAVTRIDATGRSLRLETARGTIHAAKAIVTVPTNVIASGAIRFDPSLADHQAAAAGLPLGLADKLYFELDDAEAFAVDTRLLGRTDSVDTGSYVLRSRGRPLVEGYFGGDYARRLEEGGLAAFVDAARGEIAAAYGSDLGKKLRPLVATGWARDPYAMGSYSHALPGHADDRARLATPVDERLIFAGEATSRRFFSTAHGAWEEGERAARDLIAGGRAAAAGARR